MPITLTETDLYAEISKEELDGLSKELLEDGQPDPVETAIGEGIGVIKMYVDPLTVPDDALKRLWRILSVCWIYNRLGRLPEKRKEQLDWVIATLKEIRDGKFKNLIADEDLVNPGGQGSWGSKTKLSTR